MRMIVITRRMNWIVRRARPISLTRSMGAANRDGRRKDRNEQQEMTMKTMVLAAAALLMVGGATVANAAVTAGPAAGAPAATHNGGRGESRSVQSGGVLADNPTNLPSYEMRPDGLMINGLLPSDGSQS